MVQYPKMEVNLLSDHPGKVPIRRSRGETSHLSLLQCWQGCAPCHGKAFFPMLCTLNWGASSGFSAVVSHAVAIPCPLGDVFF